MICSRGLAQSRGPKKKQTPGSRGAGANSAWLCPSPLLIPQVFLTVSPLKTWILQLSLLFHLHLPVLLLSFISSSPTPYPCLGRHHQILVPQPGSWPSAVKAQSPNPWTTREFLLHLLIAMCLFSSPHYSKHVHECAHTQSNNSDSGDGHLLWS